MWLKNRLRSVVVGMSRVTIFWVIINTPVVRYVLLTLLGFRGLYSIAVNRPHPFDLLNGTDTAGVVDSNDLPASEDSSKIARFYWGAQPSVVRSALTKLPSLEKFTFIDLGCGKGRPLLVASEFPFRSIVGVELSPSLAEIAQNNAAIMERRYPDRPRVHVIGSDAGNFRLPSGNIALYLYNPFGEEITMKVVAEVEAALASEPRTIYVIYQNPVRGYCFDASPALKRYFAANIPHAWGERGFRPEVTDGVVIWQGGSQVQPFSGAEAKIIIAQTLHRNRATIAA